MFDREDGGIDCVGCGAREQDEDGGDTGMMTRMRDRWD